MRLALGFSAGILVGMWIGVIGAVLVLETIGRAVTLDKAPDRIPDALLVRT